MPVVPIEPYVAYEHSVCWQLQDAYFAQRGLVAWDIDIPWRATSHPGMARQHAQFVGSVAPAEGQVDVLEVAGGNGAFALRFIQEALHGRDRTARRLRGRLRYILTDLWEGNLKEISANPRFKPYIDAGVLVLARADVAKPREIIGLDGKPLEVHPVAVLANYAACCTYQRVMHKSPLGWLERHVRTTVEPLVEGEEDPEALWKGVLADAANPATWARVTVEGVWQPYTPDQRFRAPVAEAVEALFGDLEEATVSVPWLFLDFIEAWGEEAHVIVTDFGRSDIRDLLGIHERNAVMFGQARSHPIDFPIFDTFADALGWRCERTLVPIRSLHVAVLHKNGGFSGAFQACYVPTWAGDLYDLRWAAATAIELKQHDRAARLYRIAIDLDPHSAELYTRYGESLLDAGHPEWAIATLQHAIRLEKRELFEAEAYDAAYTLARAYLTVNAPSDAIDAFKRSFKRTGNIDAAIYLAQTHEDLGQIAQAKKVWRQVLKLNPEHPAAIRGLAQKTP